MNIAAQPGKNFDSAVILPFGPDMPKARIRDFYRAYRRGNRDVKQMSGAAFTMLTLRGGVMHQVVSAPSGQILAVFGLELLWDDDRGPHLSMLYFVGLEALKVIVPIALYLRAAARTYADLENYDGPIWFRLRGRDGWRRKLEEIGVLVSPDGWIEGAQVEALSWVRQADPANQRHFPTA